MKALSNSSMRGTSTLELLIAFAILSLTMTAAIQVVLGNQTNGTDSQTAIEALGKSEALLEAARATARQDWSALASSGPTSDSIYTKQVSVSYPNANDTDTKLVVASVSWWDGLRPIAVKLSTIVTNSQSGAFCSATLSDPTGWKDPTAYELPTVDLVSASPLGSSANGMGLSGIYVYRGKMYLALSATPGSDTHTLYIYSLPSNPAVTPTFLGWANTVGNQLADITIAPKGSSLYAYVASGKAFNFSSGCSNATCPQFQVVDVSTPTSPVYKAGLMMPVSGSGGQGAGSTLVYDKGYVYLGLAKAAGASDTEFNIIDLGGGSASPTSPVRVGGYHVGYTVKSIAVSGNYAYLTTTDTSVGNRQLIVLDISDKANPQPVASFNAPDNFGVGNAIALSGTKAYFGKAYSSTYPNLYIFDASSPSSGLTTLGSRVVGTNDSVNSLTMRDHYAFLITNKQFQIWDAANPARLVPWTTDGTTASFFPLTSIDAKVNGSSASSCSGDLLYAALQTSQGNTKDIVAIFSPHVANSYSLANSGDISLIAGTQGATTITAATVNGYPGVTSFSASGLPSGASASFSQGSCTPGCSTTLTLTTAASTPPGTYPITVTGSAGSVTTAFNLVVTAPSFAYAITPPLNQTMSRGQSLPISITLTKSAGSAQSISVSMNGFQNGVSYSPAAGSCTPNGSCLVSFTITASGSAQKKTNIITITGSPASTNAATFSLTVQ